MDRYRFTGLHVQKVYTHMYQFRYTDGIPMVVYALWLISIQMHTCMSSQQWDLVYVLRQEVPKLVFMSFRHVGLRIAVILFVGPHHILTWRGRCNGCNVMFAEGWMILCICCLQVKV